MNDLKFACRQLLKNPGFTAVAVLTLALGIGACTAMFSVVHAVLLRPLPFREPERLVWIENVGTGGLSARTTRVDNFLEWREQNESFEELGAYFAFFDYARFTLTEQGEPRRLRGVGISQNLLDVLGVRPLLGRGFTDEECVWNGRKAALLSHAFWQQHFNGDRSVVGRTVTLNNDPTEIVGVLPRSFDFDSVFAPGTEVEMLVPFPLAEETARWGNTIFAIGRLKPTATIRQAQAEFDVISRQVSEAHPQRGGFGARMTTLEDSIRGSFRTAMWILSGAVSCVLLIACVNLSNLLLARANSRRKEFAVRSALGASPWRLVRQVLIESLVLALGGCALGVPLAFAITAGLARLKAFSIPLLQTTTVDTTVLIFTVTLSCLAGLACGILPAWQLWHSGARENLSDAGERGSGGKSTSLLRRTLVIAEVALACVLLVSAGLLIRSFAEVLNVDLGFQSKSAVAWRADPVRAFKTLAEGNRYYDQLVEKVAAIPGVESVGLTDTLPLGRNRTWGAGARGVSYPPGEYPIAFPRIVDRRYLQTMQIPLRAGRYFDARDTAESEKVIVINETLARRLWPGREAVGQMMSREGGTRVIGVVGDVRHGTLEEAGGPEMYLNFRQCSDWNAVEVVVRSSRTPRSLVPDVRAALQAYDPTLPNSEFTTLDQIVDRAVAPRRLITNLLGTFSSLALLLASIGLYGVIAYSVGQRTRELGIRMAIGAQRGDVLRLVLREGLTTAGIGVVLGLIGALLATRLLKTMLFGVSATNPLIFAVNALILMAVALAACLIPARRASRIDPMEALRHE
ncbi:MAG TPA: ABC transporter permease [Methylomirabilota bacterium]|nr:ABC transporter permease [Methylomirabilota bacterium]